MHTETLKSILGHTGTHKISCWNTKKAYWDTKQHTGTLKYHTGTNWKAYWDILGHIKYHARTLKKHTGTQNSILGHKNAY